MQALLSPWKVATKRHERGAGAGRLAQSVASKQAANFGGSLATDLRLDSRFRDQFKRVVAIAQSRCELQAARLRPLRKPISRRVGRGLAGNAH